MFYVGPEGGNLEVYVNNLAAIVEDNIEREVQASKDDDDEDDKMTLSNT